MTPHPATVATTLGGQPKQTEMGGEGGGEGGGAGGALGGEQGGARDGINVDTHHLTWKANGFEWKCEQFVDTVRKGTKDPELWHPLKQRECYLEFLDAANEGRVDELKAWEGPKHCAGWCHWSIDDNCVLEAKKAHCVDCEQCNGA